MNRSLVLLVALLLGNAYPQKVLTLKEAVATALSNNVQLQKSNAGLQSYEAGVKSSYGALLPSLSASAGWDWTRSESDINTVSNGKVTSKGESRSFSAGISSNVLLFNGLANYTGLDRARNEYQAAKYDYRKLRQDITYQAISSYYNLLNAKKLLQVKEEDLKWNAKNYEIIQERNKLGSVTLADVYSQQVKVGNAELELIRAQNDFAVGKSNFLYQLGINVLNDYDLEDISADGAMVLPEESLSLDSLVGEALANRSDMLGLKLGLTSAYQGVDIAQAGHLPTLSGSMLFGLRSPEIGKLFDSRTYSVGLDLNIPIFQGWSTEERIQNAMVQAKVKELEVSDLERDIKRSVYRSYLELKASGKRVDVSKKNVIAAAENRKIEQEKYALGSTTLLNVLIANSEYVNALANSINAGYEYLRLRDQLKYQLGVLE